MDQERTGKSGERWYLSAMTVFKDEAPYLDEWLAFCVLEGVEHLLLYDNCSTDNSREVLRPWVEAGIVELFDWPIHWKQGAQTKAFADALRRLRGRARWAAFIDPDEFLFSPTGQTLPEVLKRYEAHAGVVVNWQCYGSSGHKLRPPSLTIESYTRRARTDWARNRRVKTIVDPLLAVAPVGSHLFQVLPSHSLVTEDFRPVSIARSVKCPRKLRRLLARFPYLPFDPYSTRHASPRQISVADLRINHYVTRSEEEARSKYKDRDSMRDRDRRAHVRYHDRNEVEDPILVAKAAAVRDIMTRVRGAPALAAELILSALTGADAPALTLAELQERTGLANATIHDNVKRLCKLGEVRKSEDGHGTLWVGIRNNAW